LGLFLGLFELASMMLFIEVAPKLIPMREGGNPVLQILKLFRNERAEGNSHVAITLFTKNLTHDK